jgi:hypothetical protein
VLFWWLMFEWWWWMLLQFETLVFSRNHVSMYARVWLMLLLVIMWLISMAMLLHCVVWSVDKFVECHA